MDPAGVETTNQDLAGRAVAEGVRVCEFGGDLELYCGEGGDLIRWSSFHGINVLVKKATLKVIGLELVDFERWALKSVPPLNDIWQQYKSAKRLRRRKWQADAAVRLFHVAACVALPELAPSILARYPEPVSLGFEPRTQLELARTLAWDRAERWPPGETHASGSTPESRGLGRMVKILREQRGWDIFELARASQLRARELARIEGQLTRGRELRPRTFERLALAFGSELEPAELILRYCPQRPHDSLWQPLVERWQQWFGRQFVPLAVEASARGESGTTWHISCEVQGVSLEVRWPAGRRTQTELAIVLSPELGIDPNRPVDVGLKASRGLQGESWAEWVRRGAWHDEVLVRRVLSLPLTRPGVSLTERQKARLRRWLEDELLLNPPCQFV